MSPPEVWGPAVWTLFHTLIEKMNPDAYPYVIQSTFGMIIRICRVLPCPECSRDASNFLAKINLKDYKTKTEFKNMLYLFHNWVNAKKRKPLFNYTNMNKYASLYLPFVINNFIANYNTKGNMKLLAESFQRSFIVKDFISWFKTNSRVFIKPPIVNVPQKTSEPLETIQEENTVVEEVNTVVEEQNIVKEVNTVVEEVNTVVEENIVEEVNTVVKEVNTVVEEQNTVVEEQNTLVEEQNTVVEEQNTLVEDNVISKETTNYEQCIINEEQFLSETIVIDETNSDEKNNAKEVVEEEISIKQISKKKKSKSKK